MITARSIRDDYPLAVAELSRNGVEVFIKPLKNIIILEKNGLRSKKTISEFSAFNEAQKNTYSGIEKQVSEYIDKIF